MGQQMHDSASAPAQWPYACWLAWARRLRRRAGRRRAVLASCRVLPWGYVEATVRGATCWVSARPWWASSSPSPHRRRHARRV